jgi:hypothetical protein
MAGCSAQHWRLTVHQRIVEKARTLLDQLAAGGLHPRKLKGVHAYAIEVDRRHRLLCIDASLRHDKKGYRLMTHETYNKLTARPAH